MRILIVDDRLDGRLLLETALKTNGYPDVACVGSAEEAYEFLGVADPATAKPVDLVLLDIMMPGTNGIEACRAIKHVARLRDMPVIMVTAQGTSERLQEAFAVGATDFLARPFDIVELLARVRSALALKGEMDRRRQRERELVTLAEELTATNSLLERMSLLDGLTGVANRRRFDVCLDEEWRRMLRDGDWLSVVMIDVDHFKAFNDALGHLAGDRCLVRIAHVIAGSLRRAGDLVARFGGEEFAVLLPQTDAAGAALVAERLRQSVEAIEIDHPHSASGCVTISLGAASTVPVDAASPTELLDAADAALYAAKHAGRNRSVAAGEALAESDLASTRTARRTG